MIAQPSARRSPGLRRTAWLLLALGTLAACREREEVPAWVSPIAFDTAFVTLSDGARSQRLLVEVASQEHQRSFGLMQRPSLPDTSGMVFLYDTPQDSSSGYWMFQVRVPLDIAFFDSAGVIRRVLPMQPCASPYLEACRSYRAGVPYWGALEVNQGWFQRHGFGVGTRIDLGSLP